MGFPLPIPQALRDVAKPGDRILIALSGGVDSGVALALLSHLGCELSAVTFKNFCYSDTTDESGASCCSLSAIDDARELAFRFGAQHWVADVSDRFQQDVIDPFVASYSAGSTPNPCLECNSAVRFPELIRLADRQGCSHVATGHYARVDHANRQLLRGVDVQKDQAYFLYRVARRIWPRIVFPLGWYTKEEVRRAAQALDLPVATKPESQEICFVPDGDRSFLFPEAQANRPGSIVDRQGRVLGRHRGLVHYTVGQRRGLGIAGPKPLYVLRVEVAGNRLVVGGKAELGVTTIVCDGFFAGTDEFPGAGPPRTDNPATSRVVARIRHRHTGAPVRSWRLAGDRLTVDLGRPVHGAAPGQALVLYDDDVVLGGGHIVTTA